MICNVQLELYGLLIHVYLIFRGNFWEPDTEKYKNVRRVRERARNIDRLNKHRDDGSRENARNVGLRNYHRTDRPRRLYYKLKVLTLIKRWSKSLPEVRTQWYQPPYFNFRRWDFSQGLNTSKTAIRHNLCMMAESEMTRGKSDVVIP